MLAENGEGSPFLTRRRSAAPAREPAQRTCSAGSCAPLLQLRCCRALCSKAASHYAELARTFGARFLAYIVVSQHIIKGLVGGGGGQGLMGTPISWLFREVGGVSASRMQTLKAVALAPSALKGVIGVLSDLFPLCGWHKAPYIIALLAAAVPAFLVLGTVSNLSPESTTACLVVGFTFVFGVDLLSEAAYSKRIRERGFKQGPALVAFVWNGVFVATLLATLLAAAIIVYLGPRTVYLFCVAPSLVLLAVVLPNWHDERRLARGTRGVRGLVETAKTKLTPALRGVVITAVIVTVAAVALMIVGTLSKNVAVNLGVAVFISLVVLVAVITLLPPPMARVCTFLFIQSCCTISIESGTFFFFTDTAAEYAHGPHFSVAFYTIFVGCIALACNIAGTFLYGACMSKWSYHTTFTVATLAFCAANLLSVIVLKRWNLAVAVPDKVFVFGADAIQSTVAAWTWMPAIVLISQICPTGLEATTYSVASSCWNLGAIVAQFAGAALLESLGVRPSGSDAEGAEFEHLWLAAIIVSLMPLLPLLTLTCLIPRQRQNEELRIELIGKDPCKCWCCAAGGSSEGGRAAAAKRGWGGGRAGDAEAEAERETEVEATKAEAEAKDMLRAAREARVREDARAARLGAGAAAAATAAAELEVEVGSLDVEDSSNDSYEDLEI
tara:strand:+ start:5867 stop:7876 length:2010 start_codon:yes stop_codon:yes gene_type:complete